ncbi:YncE family protein [Nocardia pneumoniae]|uniref:YncE family protein n=1 Tax=Nocardia pneumoniae TaxID=228601 RepID=UPI0002E8042F|nr:lipoprotein [Nocardia pneumoniae]
MRPRGSILSALAGVAVPVLLAGCSSGPGGADLPSRDPATAAVAPAVTTPPAGRVLPTGPVAALEADPGTGLLAVLDGTALTVVDPGAAQPVVRTVTLPDRASSLAPGRPGEMLAAAPGRVLRVDLAGGAVGAVAVDGDARSVLARPDGGLLVGTADGRVLEVAPGGAVTGTVSGLVSADELAEADGKVTVLDRHQTAIFELDLGRDRFGLALRAGDGATRMIGDARGRFVVTDTAGGELLVYTAGPLVLRQRFPVGSSPYAIAYDQRSDTVWVTCTQRNEVVGFDLSTGIPKEVGRYATVRQPNSVTIEQHTGDLFVGSATGDGLQRIGADDRKRGH